MCVLLLLAELSEGGRAKEQVQVSKPRSPRFMVVVGTSFCMFASCGLVVEMQPLNC